MSHCWQNRRDFLGSTCAGLGGIALASLLQQDGLLAAEDAPKNMGFLDRPIGLSPPPTGKNLWMI